MSSSNLGGVNLGTSVATLDGLVSAEFDSLVISNIINASGLGTNAYGQVIQTSGGGGTQGIQGVMGNSGIQLPAPVNQISTITQMTTTDYTSSTSASGVSLVRNSSTSANNGGWYSNQTVTLRNSDNGLYDPLYVAGANLVLAGTITMTNSIATQHWFVGLASSTSGTYGGVNSIWGFDEGMGLSVQEGYIYVAINSRSGGGNPRLLVTTYQTSAPNIPFNYMCIYTNNRIQYYINNQVIYDTGILTHATGLHDLYQYSTGQKYWIAGQLPDSNSGTMTMSAGFPNNIPLLSQNLDNIIYSTICNKLQNDGTLSSSVSLSTYPFCYFSATINLPTPYQQIVGVTNAGIDMTHGYGFVYDVTSSHLFTYDTGTMIIDLGVPTFPLNVALQLTNGGVVYYENGLVVYVASSPVVTTNYNMCLTLGAKNDIITNIDFGYFGGSNVVPLWSSWNNTSSIGIWYDSGGSVETNIGSDGGYGYLDPTSMTANGLNNFTLIAGPVLGRLQVPCAGIYQMNWTLDNADSISNAIMFISINDGNADDMLNYTMLASSQAIGQTTLSITCSTALYTTDFFNLGVYIAGGGTGIPNQVIGSFTINYVCGVN